MLRTLSIVERNTRDAKLPLVTVPAATATDVLPDTTGTYAGIPANPFLTASEILYIEIFNAGANKVFFAYGRDCDATTNFNGYLVAGQAMTVNTRERVSMYSVGGTTISRTVITRITNGGN